MQKQTILAFLSVFLLANQLFAAAVVTDQTIFEANITSNIVATFDDIPAGATSPLTTNGVAIAAGVGFITEVVADVFGNDHIDFFQGDASPPNFLITNFAQVTSTFPQDVEAAGFRYTCLACDIMGESSMHWSLLDGAGNVIDSGTFAADFSLSNRFFGLIAERPFRSFVFERIEPNRFSNWILDDVRAGQSTLPAPIPTLSSIALIALASLLAFGALILMRKRHIAD